MTHNPSLHFDFLLDEERVSSSPLRIRFILPVFGIVCLLASLFIWMQESTHVKTIASKKEILAAEIGNLKVSHEAFLKQSSEVKELAAQLQQFAFYRASKNPIGETLANLTNCVSSRIQLTELRIMTQTATPLSGPLVRPKLASEVAKLCPTNRVEGMSLRLAGRAVQSGGNLAEVNRFLESLQGKEFSSLLAPSSKPTVSFREEPISVTSRLGEGSQQEVVYFEIVYECLPRRFQ